MPTLPGVRCPPWGVDLMMTVHKLSAGDGYTYLTRQVASADEPRAPGQSLADYYTARGNPPGVWVGGGAVTLGVEGMTVTETQMKALFGEGCHPNREAMLAAGADGRGTRLGAPYLRFAPTADGKRTRRAVAGYDLVFTPVKSASVLWALGGPGIRRSVEEAHHEAVRETLAWVERHAAFTRTGHAGIAQIDATGLVAATFDHRESRSGDPDLHTHVAMANKVCGVDGKWRALDARVLHSLGVAASERYNTRFEDALCCRLGVAFAERPGTEPGKRPVREIVGVPAALIEHFSKRRLAIEDRYAELLTDYRAEHGRDPNRSTQLQLAQQATLETREGKAPGRRLADQVSDWTAQAVSVVGTSGLTRLVEQTVGRGVRTVALDDAGLDDAGLEELAGQVVRTVAENRSTWTRWNAYAEAERVLRGHRFASAAARDQATEAVVHLATGDRFAIRIDEPELIREPTSLRRASDGESVFVVHGGERYTTSSILQAEESLVAAALTRADCVDPLVAEAALAVHESEGDVRLDHGQRALVGYLATYPVLLSLGIGPAGAGKTTAMRAYAAVLAADQRRLIPLASSAKAAQVLGEELGLRAENLHKFLHENRTTGTDPWFRLGPRDVVLVDEAGMAGTLQLAEIAALARQAGASVRLIGDPAQLASVEAGGALRLLESEVGGARLDHLHRFADPDEAAATLQLREGNPDALGFYLGRSRVQHGSREAMLEAAYDGWAADVRAGLTSVLVAMHGDDVRSLNARARAERVAGGQVEPDGVVLRDDNRAGTGDWVVTRSNLRGLTCHHGRDWVKNGDTWEVTRRHPDDSLTVRHLGHHGTLRLPAAYVADWVELAYGSTAHRSQGSTVDTAHALVTEEMTRESLYVASTRGRLNNRWYAATDELLDVTCDREPDPRVTTVDLLTGVLRRTAAEQAATTTIRETRREATSLPVLVSRYQHAWDLAAKAMLRSVAPATLPPDLSARLLRDPGTGRLATVLAATAGRGADPADILQAAASHDDLLAARSPALVLASRISDFPTALGVPRTTLQDQPLPWLPAPTVGHPDWDDYLAGRAALIASRADELGSLVAAYREQYRLVHLPVGDLGDPPADNTTQQSAYLHAEREQQTTTDIAKAAGRRPMPAPIPPPLQRQRGPHLTF